MRLLEDLVAGVGLALIIVGVFTLNLWLIIIGIALICALAFI